MDINYLLIRQHGFDFHHIGRCSELVFVNNALGAQMVDLVNQGFKKIYLGVAQAVRQVLEEHAQLQDQVLEGSVNYLPVADILSSQP